MRRKVPWLLLALVVVGSGVLTWWIRGPLEASAGPVASPVWSTRNDWFTITAAKIRGAATARRDIKAGNLRILHYGEPRPFQSGAPFQDVFTGYRVEAVAGCDVSRAFVAEADAYNEVMCEWHAKTRGLKP